MQLKKESSTVLGSMEDVVPCHCTQGVITLYVCLIERGGSPNVQNDSEDLTRPPKSCCNAQSASAINLTGGGVHERNQLKWLTVANAEIGTRHV